MWAVPLHKNDHFGLLKISGIKVLLLKSNWTSIIHAISPQLSVSLLDTDRISRSPVQAAKSGKQYKGEHTKYVFQTYSVHSWRYLMHLFCLIGRPLLWLTILGLRRKNLWSPRSGMVLNPLKCPCDQKNHFLFFLRFWKCVCLTLDWQNFDLWFLSKSCLLWE